MAGSVRLVTDGASAAITSDNSSRSAAFDDGVHAAFDDPLARPGKVRAADAQRSQTKSRGS